MQDLAAPIAPATRPTSGPTGSRLPLLVVTLLAVAYALFFGWLSLMEYRAFQMHALDMGNMGQAAWNTVHGHPFFFTNMRLPYQIEAWGTTTRLSFHVEALFPLISLVYLIYPHPESLLVLQTLAIASGAFAVYLLARDVLGWPWLATTFAVSYLLFPSLEGMNLYEFHPVALATPLLLFGFLFARRRQYLPFLLCCLAAMGTKEEIGLVVAMFGLYVALVNRNWRVGLGTAVIGAGWSLFAALVIEHHYRAPGTVSYLHTRYKYLGHGLRGALHTVLRNPGVFPKVLFTWPKAGYVNQLLAPLGFLPLAAAPLLGLGAPTAALNLFSLDFHMYSALGDNSAELIAVVMIAAILGARVAMETLRRWTGPRYAAAGLAAYLLLVALWNQHTNGFTPLGPRFEIPTIGRHQQIEERFVAMIPPGVPVSTQDELDPHLSDRHYLYLFEDTGRPPDPPLVPANYILLDASGPTYPLPTQQLHDYAMSYIRKPGWGIRAAEDGLILIEKGASSKRIPSRFYSYMRPSAKPSHSLSAFEPGVRITGYDVAQTDLANHRVPNLAYTLYLRPSRRIHRPLQPVLYEFVGRRMIACDNLALGLSWLPTTRWRPDRTYLVRMQPLETDWDTPGVAQLYASLQPVPRAQFPTCSDLWKDHRRLANVGTLTISF